MTTADNNKNSLDINLLYWLMFDSEYIVDRYLYTLNFIEFETTM